MGDGLLDDRDLSAADGDAPHEPAAPGDTTALLAAYAASEDEKGDEADATASLRPAGRGAHWAAAPDGPAQDAPAEEELPAADDDGTYAPAIETIVSEPLATRLTKDGARRSHAVDDETRAFGRRSATIAAALVAVVVCIGCAVAWGALGRSGFGKAAHGDEVTRRAGLRSSDAVQGALLPKDVKALVTDSFVLDGTDLSLPAEGIGVEIRSGHVVVTHRLSPETTPNPKRIVRLAGLRAGLLAQTLTGGTVIHDESDPGNTFVDLTWVVRAANGDVFLAVMELPGEMADGAGYYGALQAAHGYVIAETLLKALGSSSGLAASAGEAPVDVKGKLIVANATYKKPKKNETNTQNVQFDQKDDATDDDKTTEKDKDKDKDKKSDDKGKKDKEPSKPSKPTDTDEPSKPDPEPDPEPEPEPQPQPDPEPDPEPEPQPDPQPEPDPEPEPDPQPEPDPEPSENTADVAS